jgi:hypothetical protein
MEPTPSADLASPMATTTPVLSEATRAAVLEAEGNNVPSHCLVCYGDLTLTTITPCHHNEICGVCHLRLRHLHRDKKCPICKSKNDHVIVDQPGKEFDEYPIYGNELGTAFTYRDDVGMFFLLSYYETDIKPLFGYHCTEQGCTYDGSNMENVGNANAYTKKAPNPTRGLVDHLRTVHRKALCQLCVDHQRDFVSRLSRFSPSGLKKHLAKGDGPMSGFEGHPACEFCRGRRFYDITELHQHLNKDHYKCHVCEKQGLHNQFFSTYQSLERHFDSQHFLCKDVQCLQARFTVFENELDLRHHERQVHGGVSSGSSKIQLEFRVRRSTEDPSQEIPTTNDFNYGVDGQAFVPQALPQVAGNVSLHPMHVERTAELRQQAEALRQNYGASDTTESFPSLAETDAQIDEAATQSLRLGWTSGLSMQRMGGRRKNAGQVTEEDFPTLRPVAKQHSSAMLKLPPKGPTIQNRSMQSTSNGKWRGTVPSVAISRTTPAFLTPSSNGAVSNNGKVNLIAADFPTLAAGPKANQYAAADAITKRNRARGNLPPFNSVTDFPPPPLMPSTSTSARNRMLVSNVRETKSPLVAGNTLNGRTSVSNTKVSVEDMKITLGVKSYKRLKQLTKEFASNALDPDAYIDHAAAIFDKGYGDSDFWRFLPPLLSSCPNHVQAERALIHMESF